MHSCSAGERHSFTTWTARRGKIKARATAGAINLNMAVTAQAFTLAADAK